jgi:hypothetical protein
MGVYRENGYSASVEAFLVVDGDPIRLAKTNGNTITLAKPHELLPGTIGELLIIVDNDERSTTVVLPDGAIANQTVVNYRVTAPF